MNYQPGQQPQWPPQKPAQSQIWNPAAQKWSSSQIQSILSTKQFKGPTLLSLPYRQPQQSQYNLPPVTSYIPPQKKPFWQQKQFQQAKTRPVKPGFFSKKIEIPLWMLILVVGVICSLIGVIGWRVSISDTGNTPPRTSSSSTVSSTSSGSASPIPTAIPTVVPTHISTDMPTPTPSPAAQPTVGSTFIANGVACTFVSLTHIQGDQSNPPTAGTEYIVVHVKLVNKSSAAAYYNPLAFHVKSGKQNILNSDYSPPQSYTADNILTSGKLAALATVEGDLIFQVPIGDHSAELTWLPTFGSNPDNYAWNLGL